MSLLEHHPGRPGNGGRLPYATPHTATTATAELIAQHGHPETVYRDGVNLMIWTVDPDGRGIIFARLSSRDLQHGETAMLQVHPARDLCIQHELTPRLIVVSTNNSGARDFERRPDFQIACQAIDDGWCDWVQFRDEKRLAREPLPFEQFWRHLRDHEVELWLTGLGRAVRWPEDRLLLRTLSNVSAEDREDTVRRMHGALEARWLAEGRGWPGMQLFGIRRNPITKFLEVDPDQYEFVKRICLTYASCDGHGRAGVRQLRRELRTLGCELSEPQIIRVLRERVFVDGTMTVSHGGKQWPVRPLRLADPVPEEVWQRNQELLQLRRGSNTFTPPHTFCLNGVEVVHAVCQDRRDPRRGLPARLRGRVRPHSSCRSYRHEPWVPETCRGFSIDQHTLDGAVLDALARALAEDPLVRDEWARANRVRFAGVPDVLDDGQAEGARRRLSMLERQYARLSRSFRDRLADGDPVDERDFAELVGGVRSEIDEIKRRLAACELRPRALQRAGALSDRDDRALRTALAQALTADVPDTAEARELRAALVQASVDRVEVHDRLDGVDVHLSGPLSPVGQPQPA